MLVNITDVLSSEGKENILSTMWETDRFVCQLGTFPVSKKEPVEIVLSNISDGKARLRGKCSFTFTVPCDRCLKDVEVPLTFSFEREVFAPDKVDAESLEDDDNIMDGYQLDVDKLLYNEILMNWPMKVLCKPDCKGICKKCGKDLNEGDCGCDTFVPDPRMAAIKEIFNASKEV